MKANTKNEVRDLVISRIIDGTRYELSIQKKFISLREATVFNDSGHPEWDEIFYLQIDDIDIDSEKFVAVFMGAHNLDDFLSFCAGNPSRFVPVADNPQYSVAREMRIMSWTVGICSALVILSLFAIFNQFPGMNNASKLERMISHESYMKETLEQGRYKNDVNAINDLDNGFIPDIYVRELSPTLVAPRPQSLPDIGETENSTTEDMIEYTDDLSANPFASGVGPRVPDVGSLSLPGGGNIKDAGDLSVFGLR